ncbi:trypsin-like serine peptidase [Candidatus Litorirhabdus singularis]|nr:trypsin-like peptidase domain-containing protein [Candidatus Litorirhabdus singularis]
MPYFLLLPLLLLLAIASPLLAEPRQLHNNKAPGWMASVGKLTVPGQKWEDGERHHYQENCSGTLISKKKIHDPSDTRHSARYVISAWHCLEYYNDLSKAISFSLPNSEIEHNAALVISGGSMNADWVLLRLDQPIAIDAPIVIWTEPASIGKTTLTSAGYSRDLMAADNGRLLSYHPDCSVTAIASAVITTNCRAAKGASGGPLVAVVEGEVRLLGVLSAGDGEAVSLYVPSDQFARRVAPYLRR